MAVVNLWSGRVKPHSFQVVAKIEGSSARLAVSASANLSSPQFFNCDVVNGIAKGIASGLSVETIYFYAIEDSGVLDTAKTGRCKTTQRYGLPASLKFGAFSCAGSGNNVHQYKGSTANISNSPHFVGLRDKGIELLIHLGDIHYRDINSNNPSLYRTAYDNVLAEPNQQALYAAVPIVYLWDDHDYGPNDSDKNIVSRPAAVQVFRERLPSHELPSTNGAIYTSFVAGRIKFVVTDMRSERDAKGLSDTIAKRVFSQEQEDWFLAELIEAKRLGQVVCWVGSFPYIAATTTGEDHWGVFSAYRNYLYPKILDTGIGGAIFMITGDMHALAIDDGRNNQWGGFPVFQFAAMDAQGSNKGGPYWKGPSSGGNRYGIIDIVDDGFEISITGTGYISGSVWDSYTFTVPMPPKVQNRGNAVYPMVRGPEGWQASQIRGAA